MAVKDKYFSKFVGVRVNFRRKIRALLSNAHLVCHAKQWISGWSGVMLQTGNKLSHVVCLQTKE